MKTNIITLILLLTANVISAVVPAPEALKVNYIKHPLGIDVTPEFSWEIRDLERNAVQSAYEVMVAADEDALEQEKGILWDSRKVESDRTFSIRYEGKNLEPASRYYWKVRTWDGKGNISPWSEPGWFETGLFSETDWKGSWISDGSLPPAREEDFYKKIPAPMFRKTFDISKKVTRARLYICGLGYNDVYINGKRPDDIRLDPGWTQYAKTVYYNVHDVTGELKQGKNAIGVVLGNGWYNPLPLRVFGRNLRTVLTIGQPVLRCRLNIEYADGTSDVVVSDKGWKTSESPVIRNNLYLGEWYDARMEQPGWSMPGFNDKNWKNAVKAEGPAGKLTWEFIPPVRKFQTLNPVQIQEPEPGVYVYDLGQNFAGTIRFISQAEAGTEIRFRYAEIINPDNTINVNTTAAGQIKHPGQGGPGAPDVAWQEDRYYSNGNGVETFEPRFIFHGFRYVEVSGLPYKPSLNDLEGLVLHSDIKDVSEFQSSSDLFNQIQHITEWAMLSNVFSVESDCPAREKFGYGGDMVTASEAFMNNYDMSNFYQKSVRDFERDALPDGAMTECAPNVSINERGPEEGAGPVGWTLAHPFLLWQLYKYYGNLDIVKEQYPALKKLVDLLHEHAPDNLVMDGIGDHNSVDERPRPVSATSAYYHHVIILAKFAEILGKPDDAAKYNKLAEDIKKAFIDKFVDQETGKVYTGYEACQVFALYYDLLPGNLRRRAMQQLLDEIQVDRHGHLTTGIFSTKMMLNYLSDHGRDDISFLMLNQRDFPGYGYMIENGATTLWENWDIQEHDSKNHPMFGSVSEWFYKSVLGIQQTDSSVAFSDILINPSIVGDLTWAKGSYHSVRGKISSSWERSGSEVHLDVTIPANATATIHVPVLGNAFPDIYEGNDLVVSGGKATGKEGVIRMTGINNQAAVFRVGSGTYRFVVK